jgi:hypothetical protein
MFIPLISFGFLGDMCSIFLPFLGDGKGLKVCLKIPFTTSWNKLSGGLLLWGEESKLTLR